MRKQKKSPFYHCESKQLVKPREGNRKSTKTAELVFIELVFLGLLLQPRIIELL